MELDPGEEEQALRDLGWHSVRWSHTLSGVELSIPSTGLVDRLGRLCAALLFVLPLLTPLWVWLGALSLMGIVWPALVLLALLLSPRANNASLTVVLSPQALSTPGWSLPLEDIDALLVDRSWRQCRLAIVPRGEAARYIEVPGPLVAQKLSLLVERHAARRRVALQGEGHDVQCAAQPPEALAEMVRTRR